MDDFFKDGEALDPVGSAGSPYFVRNPWIGSGPDVAVIDDYGNVQVLDWAMACPALLEHWKQEH